MKAKKTFGNIVSKLNKNKLLFLLSLFLAGYASGQEQLYDNFEGIRVLHYGERSGVLDTLANNPAPNSINSSAKCGLYVRNGAKKFANIKMNLTKKLTGVEQYATYNGIPKKIKMKVYTAAPAGTLVEVLLGSRRGNNDYPAGTHSQYQAYTTVSNAWEELEFKFSQIPQGSETSASQIDQIVLLFNPNSINSDTYYFDALTGPSLSADKVEAEKKETIINPEKEVKANAEKEKSNRLKTVKQTTTNKNSANKNDSPK